MTTKTKKPPAPFTVTQVLDDEAIRGLLCSAIEGGSNYWYVIEGYRYARGLKHADFVATGKCQNVNGASYWHPAELLPTWPGCAVIFSVTGDAAVKGRRFRLDRVACQRGLDVMQAQYPRHYASVVSDNSDAETGDVFLQCALFGEIVYG